MERCSDIEANNIIKVICEISDREHLKSHLILSWLSNDKNFAKWYLNLDVEFMYYILATFKVLNYRDSEEAEYLNLIEADPIEAALLPMPDLLEQCRNLLIFFIGTQVRHTLIPGTTLSKVPKKTFGNSANWGDYILSLPSSDQKAIIQHILTQNI